MGPLLRPQSPETSAADEIPSETTLINQVTHPYGLSYVKVESVGLVTGLVASGSDPAFSPQRAALLAEMNRREVDDPNKVLASRDTALVLVRGFLRPGIREGDPFDIEVRIPSQSDATSLRNGWLLETRLTELAVLGDQIRKGHLLAVSQGPVLVDPSASVKEDAAWATRGRVLGGGIATKTRNLGLVLDHELQSVRLSQQIGKAINRRFHSYSDGRQQGIASPKTDEFIELQLHPRYKDNVGRFMRVVRNIAVRETSQNLQSRLQLLSSQLLDPVTSATAALRLEAVGDEEAISILEQGLVADDPEVRFYSSEALAYLDVTDAVESLARTAREEPAFRVHALAALSAMDDGAAYDALRELLEVKSAETRYGAFRALWAMSPGDPLVHGQDLAGQFTFHTLDVPGPAMIHVTSSHRPEIVMFGSDHQFKLPLVLDAGQRILVNGLSGGKIKISRFGETTQQRVVSTRVEDVVRTVVELGGTYPDVVEMLQQANESKALKSRFRVNALPETGRQIMRSSKALADQTGSSGEILQTSYEVDTPRSELFGQNNE